MAFCVCVNYASINVFKMSTFLNCRRNLLYLMEIVTACLYFSINNGIYYYYHRYSMQQ